MRPHAVTFDIEMPVMGGFDHQPHSGCRGPELGQSAILCAAESRFGIPEEASLRVLKILNGDRQVYRHVVAHGALEYQAMLQGFAERGFVVDTTEEDAPVHLPEPSALETAGPLEGSGRGVTGSLKSRTSLRRSVCRARVRRAPAFRSRWAGSRKRSG